MHYIDIRKGLIKSFILTEEFCHFILLITRIFYNTTKLLVHVINGAVTLQTPCSCHKWRCDIANSLFMS